MAAKEEGLPTSIVKSLAKAEALAEEIMADKEEVSDWLLRSLRLAMFLTTWPHFAIRWWDWTPVARALEKLSMLSEGECLLRLNPTVSQ